MSPYDLVICENDPGLLHVFDTIFHEEAYQLTTFSTALATLHHLRTRATPVTVLFDSDEPTHHHASRFVASLINDPALRHQHTYLLMTTTTLPERLQEVLRHVPMTIVYKPFDLADFLTTISHAVQYTMLRHTHQPTREMPHPVDRPKIWAI